MTVPKNDKPTRTAEMPHCATASIAGTELILLASKMAWWPNQKALLLADAHFGKAAAFRKAGIPVPGGTTASMLAKISVAIQSFSAEQLILLGDFIHSSNRAEEDYEVELKNWRKQHAGLNVALVQGNHDSHFIDVFEQLNFTLHKTNLHLGPFALCHDPTLQPQDDDRRYRLGGHIHPGYTSAVKGSKSLPCFWLTRRFLVFPAFGPFTGTARITPGAGDTIYAISKDQIARVYPLSFN